MAEVRTGIGLYGELRSPPIFWPLLLFVQARARAQAGRPAEGCDRLDTRDRGPEPRPGASMLPEVHLVKGDLLAALPAGRRWWPGGGRGLLPARIRAGGRARCPDGALRAATRLARLRLAEGDPAAAGATLRPVYDTFTEGFEAADLVEAREILAGT